MTAYKLMNMPKYEYGTVFKVEDHTHGSIKDADSTRSKYRWEGGDVERMLEYTFNGSRVEVRPGPTNLKGSWNPSGVHTKPVCFPLGHEEAYDAAEQAMNLSKSTLSYVSDRLREANLNMFIAPPANVHTLVSLLMGQYQTSEALAASGGHDVRLLLADCIAELNDTIYKPEDLCHCMSSTDGVSNANGFFPDMYRHCAGALFYGEVWHTHVTPADLYTLQIRVTSRGPCIHSRPRLTPFGALSELPRLLPENKTKVQLEAIDAMYELIGSPWKVWP